MEKAPHQTEQTKEEYTRLSKEWEKSIKAYPFRLEVMYPNIIEGLGIQNKDQCVVDLACGTGYLTNMIAQQVTTYGVDNNQEMLSEARRLYPEIQFIQTDIRALPFKDKSIDAISASCAYHYATTIEELAMMLSESARILKLGGRISGVLSDPDHPTNEWIRGTVRSAEWVDEPYQRGARISIGVHDPETGEKQDAFTVYYYSSDDYQKAFKEAGFEFEWLEYRPSKEFMKRPNAQELIDAVQVRLFAANKI